MASTTRYGALLAALALAAPAAASAAPTVAVDGSCYTPEMPVGLSGTGFTPGGPVALSLSLGNAMYSFDGSAAATGTIGGEIPLPGVDEQVDATLTAVDQSAVPPGQPPAAEQTATVTFKASPWYMFVPNWGNGDTLGIGRHRARTRVEAVGFVGTASTTLYAHYVRRGRHVKTTRIGRLRGPCGDLQATFRQFPFKVKRGASYAVTFDTTRAWPNDDAGILYPRVKVRRGRATRRLLQLASPPLRAVGRGRGA
jgi:hypothetical protein